MKLKKTFSKILILFILAFIIIGLIKVNIINSKALSPLVKDSEVYDLAEREIYDTYSSFINDDALIKIYNQDSNDILIKIGDKDYKINKEININEYTENILKKIEVLFSGL